MSVAPASAQPGREQHRVRWLLVAVVAFLLGGVTVAVLYEFDVSGDTSGSATVGSGVPATQAREVAAFTTVELEGANNVVIHVGEKQSVVVKADDNLVDHVTTEVQSGNLVIGNTSGSFTTKSPMSVDVEIPALTALTLSGSGNIVAEDITAERLEVALPGSGTITGSGDATDLDITVAGSGMVRLTRLVAHDVRAVVSGSGSVYVTASTSLDASVAGSGTIVYAGNPQDVTQDVSGSGAITGR